MQRRFLEQATLFFSIVKWTLLATLTGGVVGSAVSFFLKTLDFSIRWVRQLPSWPFLLPLGGLACGWIFWISAREGHGEGTEQVITAVHERQGRIPLSAAPMTWITAVLTIATGGSAGKESPGAHIGGSLASTLARLLWLRPEDRRKLAICGISAGFVSVFGTPIAGSLFAIEVLFLGQLLYDVLYPSFVSGIISYQVSRALGVGYFHHPLSFVPQFTEVRFLKVIGAGILFGLASLLLIEGLKIAQAAFGRLRMHPILKPALGGLILLVLANVASSRYLGLGMAEIERALSGEALPRAGFLWKILFTGITLGSGGSGGIITPIFFIGSTLGNALAPLFRMDTSTLSAIGMVALLAGAANTPISASVMAIEFFGAGLGPYACIACIASFLFSGHRSVYTSQRLGMRKSEALKVPLQEIVGEIERVELGEEAEALLNRITRLVRRRAPRRGRAEQAQAKQETKT